MRTPDADGPRIGSLFTGAGGLDEGVKAVYGGRVVWHSEIDKDASKVLAARYPDVPNLGDVTAVDWSQVEPVDILTGGFPCQDLSTAGMRRGLRPGTRSGLWTHMAYAIDQLRPQMVVIENVRGILSAKAKAETACDVEPCDLCVGDDPDRNLRALGAVLGDLASLGYDARWGGVRASDAGAPHQRFRAFVVAHPADSDVLGHARRDGHAPDHVGCDAEGRVQGCEPEPPVRVEVGQRVPHGGPGTATADSESVEQREPAEPRPLRDEPGAGAGGGTAAADTCGGQLARPAALGDGLPEPSERAGSAPADFGPYTPAVRRWEHVTGTPAPSPTEPGRSGPRLSPDFTEWMMGWPVGWTDVGISRNARLKVCGNGVVPQQAALALRLLGGE